MAVRGNNNTNIWLAVITTILLMYVLTSTFVLMNMKDNIIHMTHQLDAIYQAVDTMAYDLSWDRYDSEFVDKEDFYYKD